MQAAAASTRPLATSRVAHGTRLDPQKNAQFRAQMTPELSQTSRTIIAVYRRARHFVAGWIWFFVLVLVVGVIYPPAAAAFACTVTTAAGVAWILLWLGGRR